MKHPLTFILLAGLLSACSQKDDLAQILPLEPEATQQFSINPLNDTVIVGRKGTRFKFSQNCFIDSLGQEVSEPIAVTLKEFYTIEDFINNRLSTRTTDGRLLSSSGMIFLEVMAGNKKLQIKQTSPATIMFPRAIDSDVANLFSGELAKYGAIEWNELTPVHNDTTLLVAEIVNKFGVSELRSGLEGGGVNLEVYAVIGRDTTKLTEENRKAFDKVLRRTTGLSYADYEAKLQQDRTTRLKLFEKFDYYVFQTNQLGYINCDIFINEQLHPFTVQVTGGANIFIILDSLNAVIYPDSLTSTRSANEIQMSAEFRLPNNKSITVVSYGVNEADTYSFDITRSNTSKKKVSVKTQPTTLEQIKKAIKSVTQK